MTDSASAAIISSAIESGLMKPPLAAFVSLASTPGSADSKSATAAGVNASTSSPAAVSWALAFRFRSPTFFELSMS